jgi:hypothetical protein
MSNVYSVIVSGHQVLFILGFFEVVEWSNIPYVEDKVLFTSTSAKDIATWCFNNSKQVFPVIISDVCEYDLDISYLFN